MTTILYNHDKKQIAVDSRRTMSNGVIHDDNADKSIKINNELWFVSGISSESVNFVKLKHGDKIVSPFECYALIIKEGLAYIACSSSDGYMSIDELSCNFAIGSGDEFALAALDFKATTKEAVEYAITKDCYSGGAVRVFNLDGEEVK